MDAFIDQLMPLALIAVGAAVTFGVKGLKEFIKGTPTKIDDQIWNKLVNEFAAVGTISPEQLHKLKTMSTTKE